MNADKGVLFENVRLRRAMENGRPDIRTTVEFVFAILKVNYNCFSLILIKNLLKAINDICDCKQKSIIFIDE